MVTLARHGHRQCRNLNAFTLIELLIVVAIIAVLASIAVVNFLESQIRSKVAASRSNMRVIAGAIEAYAVDNAHYPPNSGVGVYETLFGRFADPVSVRLIPLTSPISYISAVPKDLFHATEAWSNSFVEVYDAYDYVDAEHLPPEGSGLSSGAVWRLCSPGPDLYMAYGGRTVTDPTCNTRGVEYDPTNGTVSNGDLVRVGAVSSVGGNPLDSGNPNRPGIVRAPIYREQW